MSLHEALLANDKAHQKTISEEARAGTLSNERIVEIEEEARMWVRHLQSIHADSQ